MAVERDTRRPTCCRFRAGARDLPAKLKTTTGGAVFAPQGQPGVWDAPLSEPRQFRSGFAELLASAGQKGGGRSVLAATRLASSSNSRRSAASGLGEGRRYAQELGRSKGAPGLEGIDPSAARRKRGHLHVGDLRLAEIGRT